MGFFDRFRKRVQEVADETDFDELTAEEGTEEAPTLPPSDVVEDEWDELNEIEPTTPVLPSDDDDWDDWDDEPEPLPSTTISKKERKQLEREKKAQAKRKGKIGQERV